jgi:2-(1,2-epoxy-1,2-dihydrophenyl)acetyl-CoA isomerase
VSDQLHLHVSDGLVTLTIDRPESMNALTPAMITEMTGIARALTTDTRCRVVAIRHVGKHLCAGADTGDIFDASMQPPAERAAAFYQGLATQVHPLLRALRAIPQPIVIGARGHAIGLGVQFLLVADLVVASETLTISLPQVQLGHIFDHGESYLLPRQMGPRKAMEMALLGDRMNAADAERFQLINFLVPDRELEARTDDVIARLLRLSPVALLRSKAAMRSSETADLETQLETERVHAAQCAATDDFVEAIAAFQQKRAPNFSGR